MNSVVTSDPKLAVGTVVLGDVRVDEQLCVAGLGAMYRGRLLSHTEPVLLRVFRSEALARVSERFERELSVVRLVEHAGVVAPLRAGIEGDRAIVVYPGGTLLCAALRDVPKMALSEVGRIVNELAEILDHAHRETVPLVHGALSSSSVVLEGRAGPVRLLDVGVVQALERVGVFDDGRWDVLLPAAAAPEVVTRTFPVAEATDVFGLASIAFECLTGRPPFPALSVSDAQASIVSGKRPSAQALRSELHPDVDRVLATAWSVDPRSRSHEASAFANALSVALARSASRALTSAPPPEDPDDDGPTVVHAVPARAQRAMTLPFGIKTNPPRTDPPPPPGPTTVPRLVAAETIDRATRSEPPPPQISVAPVVAPVVAPAPPPASPEPAQRVHTVSVTAVVVSLVLGSSLVVGGGLIGGSILMARRAPSERTVVPLAPTPAPSPMPSVAPPAPSATPSVAPPPAPSAAPEPKEPEAPSVATSTTSLWPDMPKELGPRPSPKALDTLRARLKTAFEPCLKMTPKPPPGMPWMVHFELDGASGRALGVEVSRPYKGSLAGACLQRAALDARVPPFDSKTWSIDLRFGPT